jgi:hypothetical protein
MVYQLKYYEFWGFQYIARKVLKIPFQWCITCPQNFKIAITKQKIKMCSRLVIVDQGGQKNRNGKTTTVLFRNVSY